ncbi:hypothetical protein KLN47_06900 [Clostridioides difficile]|nr:hypothetical protein [Clostridioides difficile]
MNGQREKERYMFCVPPPVNPIQFSFSNTDVLCENTIDICLLTPILTPFFCKMTISDKA